MLAYSRPRSTGLIACGIEEEDELIEVKIAREQQDVLMTTRHGMAIRFAQVDLRSCGRQAVGVRGISLRGEDFVVGMDVLDPDASILTVTELGHGKRTAVSQYRTQRRAGYGLITIKADSRNGLVAGSLQVRDSDHIMIVTSQGRLTSCCCGQHIVLQPQHQGRAPHCRRSQIQRTRDRLGPTGRKQRRRRSRYS